MCERAARSFHFPANACDKVGEVLATLNVGLALSMLGWPLSMLVWFLSGLSLNMAITMVV